MDHGWRVEAEYGALGRATAAFNHLAYDEAEKSYLLCGFVDQGQNSGRDSRAFEYTRTVFSACCGEKPLISHMRRLLKD